MENASKALLIAAAVLIVILLIAFGMRIFNSTTGTTDSVEETMNATEVASFNSKFTQYVGTNKSRAQVMALLNVVIANNSTSSTHIVKVNNSTEITNIVNGLTDKKYIISIPSSGGIDKGYVVNINIE